MPTFLARLGYIQGDAVVQTVRGDVRQLYAVVQMQENVVAG